MPSNEGKKTILVVDDEPEVRKLVGAMVGRYGFNVLTADTGEHAITLFKKKMGEIHLLLTDVVAPGMSGPVLADKLTELQPGLKVLFMSGYDNTQVVQHYVVEKGHALLPKPFTLEELGRKVEEVLGEPLPHTSQS
ncbi:MAG TPA: response regulator [Bryobacteraceae bacterium]|nr:response regulator [Bryobacteraceae bacterium]